MQTFPLLHRASRLIPVCPLLLALAVLTASAGGGCARADFESLGWVRRGDFHVRGRTGDEILLEYRPTPGGDDLVQLYGPDGRRLRAMTVASGASGQVTFRLDAGAGDYRLVAGPGHRYRASTNAAGLVFEPETIFPCLFQREGEGGPYYFRVSDGERPLLIATNQNDFEGSAARVALFDPSGAPAGSFDFETLSEETLWARLGASEEHARLYRERADTMSAPQYRVLLDTMRVGAGEEGALSGAPAESRSTISDASPPAPGFWRIEAGVTEDRADDVGFWLEGTANLVAPSPERWFAPRRPATEAAVEIDARRVVGRSGILGVVWDWPSFHQEARRAFLGLGITADKHFLPQSDIEPENDDGSPLTTRPERFHFDEWRHRMEPTADPELGLTSLIALTRPSPFARARPEEFAEFVEEAIAYHTALPGVPRERFYWQFMNEPNHEMRPQVYAEWFRVAGERLAHSSRAAVREARFGGPGIGQAQDEEGVLDLRWIRELLLAADEVLDFVVWNQYRLPRLEQTWRYAELVRATRDLCLRYDTDGRPEEIVIGATNMKGGVVLHNERQDGFYGALWWASVVVNAFSTGEVSLLNYFYLIDQGSRRKGLLFADGSWKPVARMTALLTRSVEEEVVEAASNHSEVEVLATRSAAGDAVALLLVNKMDRPVDLATLRARLPQGWSRLHAAAVLFAEGDDRPREAWTADRQTAGGWWEAPGPMPPRSVMAVRLERR